jgi:hypothetical protein
MALAPTYAVPVYLISPGAPAAGTNAVQSLTMTGGPTSGSFTLSFEGVQSATIPWNATTAQVETALNNLPTVASGGTASIGVAVTGGAFPGTAMTITFSGDGVAKRPATLLVLQWNGLIGGTNPTVTPATSTPGVAAFGRGAPIGAIIVDTTNGVAYKNSGTPSTPVWSAAG